MPEAQSFANLVALVFAAAIHEGYTTGVLVSSYELSIIMLLPT